VGQPVSAERVAQLRRQLAAQAQGQAPMAGGTPTPTPTGAVNPMQGDGLRRPLNAPSGIQAAPGVQPGVSNNIVLARLVIVSGLGIDGVYVYQAGTTPGLGNPPIAWESSGLIDPYGNVLPATTGVAGTGSFAAGNTRITPSATLTYSTSAPVANTLTASNSVDIVGVDSAGNHYLQGTVAYGPDTFTGVGYIAAQIWNGAINWYYTADMTSGIWRLESVMNWDDSGMLIQNPGGSVTIEGIKSTVSANGVFFVDESLDTTGVTDYNNLIGILAAGNTAVLSQGTYYLSQPLSWANAQLLGTGDDCTIQPGSSWAGAALLEPGANTAIMNLAGYGGSTTRSGNPAANFIQLQAGAQFWRVEDILSNYMNGIVVQCAPTAGSHGTIRCVKGEHNAGGIRIDNGTAVNVTAEINITDIDLQNCETGEILYLSDVTDVLVAGPMNGSILSGAAVNGITVTGTCQTCLLSNLDIGTGSGTGMLVFSANATGSPTEIEVGPGTLQQGAVGVVVNGASARLAFRDVWAKGNQGDGWQFNGTGAGIVLTGCGGNGNNAAAGVAYDMNVTSTAHILNQGFRYISTGVTDGRFLAAGNHYTEGFPPAALTSAGAAPGGW